MFLTFFEFQSWPRLYCQIEAYVRGEVVKKAAIFTKDEILQFLAAAPSSNRFWSIRKVVVTLAFLGGNRLHELRHAKQSALEKCSEGYYFNFIPAKQRGICLIFCISQAII